METNVRSQNVPSLTLTLQESQNVLLPYGTLHVPDDCPTRVVHELDTDLSDTSTGASPTKNLGGRKVTISHNRKHPRGPQATLMTVASLTGAFDESCSNVRLQNT